jgi:hypothetical protein
MLNNKKDLISYNRRKKRIEKLLPKLKNLHELKSLDVGEEEDILKDDNLLEEWETLGVRVYNLLSRQERLLEQMKMGNDFDFDWFDEVYSLVPGWFLVHAHPDEERYTDWDCGHKG